MAKVKVKVCRKHIRRGTQNNTAYCPIALAMREAGIDAKVWNDTWQRDGVVGGKRYKLPIKAMKFIQRFDNDMRVDPFEFTLTGV